MPDNARHNARAGQPTRYIGIQAIADVTGRDLDELHDALDALLCQRGHPASDEACAVEMLSTTTHPDLGVVRRWVVGPTDDDA